MNTDSIVAYSKLSAANRLGHLQVVWCLLTSPLCRCYRSYWTVSYLYLWIGTTWVERNDVIPFYLIHVLLRKTPAWEGSKFPAPPIHISTIYKPYINQTKFSFCITVVEYEESLEILIWSWEGRARAPFFNALQNQAMVNEFLKTLFWHQMLTCSLQLLLHTR